MGPQCNRVLNILKNKINSHKALKLVSRCSSTVLAEKTDDKHRVYSFGLAEHGALGLQKGAHSRVKNYYSKPIRHFFAEDNCVTHVVAGYGFSAFSVVSEDTFKVYGCGLNTDFQIGFHQSPGKVPLEIITKPAPINLGLSSPNTQVVGLSAGRAHLAVLTDHEGVFLVGSNCYGQCGRELTSEDKFNGTFIVNNIPRINGEEISDVSCGQDHTIFLTKCGQVYSCGWSCDGQTGLGHTNATPMPCPVTGDLHNERIVKISGKSDSVFALNEKGEVFCWGNNEYLQLCEAQDMQQINAPVKFDSLKCYGRIVDIDAGGSFCVAVNEAGEVFVWGYGILGGGPNLQKTAKPFKLPLTLFGWSMYQPDAKVVKVACGLSHMAAINNYGHLYTWGKNRLGCLGIGHVRDQYFPYKVALSGIAKSVSCGVDHTMVLCKSF